MRRLGCLQTGLRGSLTSEVEQDTTEQEATVVEPLWNRYGTHAAMELIKASTKESNKERAKVEKPSPKFRPILPTYALSQTDDQFSISPERSRARATGPLACTDAAKHSSVSITGTRLSFVVTLGCRLWYHVSFLCGAM
jgi:hypothetical protein